MKWNKIIPAISFILFSTTISVFVGCDDDDDASPQKEYELVWADEFDGPEGSTVDPAKWTFDLGTGSNGWGNQELQYYTDRPDNISLDGEGRLAITARNESFANSSYTSGRMLTKDLFEQTYGRFEARIKLPFGPGIWPAFWMLGTNIDEVSWPQCGEIDIMEYRGQEPTVVHGSLHGPGYSAGNAVTQRYSLVNDRFDLDFHIYTVEWGENYIHYFVDGDLYQQITPDDVSGEWVFDADVFLIFNVAVGGSFVGSPTQDTPFPQTMLVDWVRVYKEFFDEINICYF